jgi:ubiquinone/menaquinone biosynthesis C-methylase UbiE
VVGYDFHGPSIERARAHAAAAGVSDRVAFRDGRADQVEPGLFDLVTLIDCLHDMGNPVSAASTARRALKPGGAVLIVEPASSDRMTDNFNPIGRMYYASSTAFCTPAALAQEGGWALGSQGGPARLRAICEQAGLPNVEQIDGTPFQSVFAAVPRPD